ncbi:MAG: hypothetical protein KC503_43625, partial [Myxococcales bacterium]|nr:hypothetical protein [Myxococcales bacterium]
MAPSTAHAQNLRLQGFKATAVDQTVTYEAEVCGQGSTKWAVYYDLTAPPTPSTTQDGSTNAPTTGCGQPPQFSSIVWNNAPIGLYQSYAFVDPDQTTSESNENDNVAGPIEVCVGPDVVLKTFSIEAIGASVTYKVQVCNEGSMAARKFRVGFWHDRKDAPPNNQQGDVFKSLTVLDAGACEDLVVPGGLRPNGSFIAWARADAGDFVLECRENNNPFGPQPYSLSNPDLYVKSFTAEVNGANVTYKAEVCNKGTAPVTKFFVDVYYHRTTKIPF